MMMQTAEMGRRAQIGEMLPLLLRHEIQVLLRAGHTVADVAVRTGASDDSVRRVRREDVVAHVDDAAAHRVRGIGRPSKTVEFTEKVVAWLREEPELPTLELLRRAKEHMATPGARPRSTRSSPVCGPRAPRRSFASKGCPVSSRSMTSGMSMCGSSTVARSAFTSLLLD